MEMWRAVVCATSGFAFRGVWHQGSFDVEDGRWDFRADRRVAGSDAQDFTLCAV
jgi:hypothetical protein